MTDMGTFRTTIGVESFARRGTIAELHDVLVDTGAEATWIPRAVLEQIGVLPEGVERYQMADGRELVRQVGHARVHVAGKATADDVVFGEHGDAVILGARSMEGLNLRVDPRTKQLVYAGPKITALAQVTPWLASSDAARPLSPAQ